MKRPSKDILKEEIPTVLAMVQDTLTLVGTFQDPVSAGQRFS